MQVLKNKLCLVDIFTTPTSTIPTTIGRYITTSTTIPTTVTAATTTARRFFQSFVTNATTTSTTPAPFQRGYFDFGGINSFQDDDLVNGK